MKELFDEAKRGDIQNLDKMGDLIKEQFKNILEGQIFEKNKKLEQDLLIKYESLRKSFSEYKEAVKNYWDSKAEEFSPFNILINYFNKKR